MVEKKSLSRSLRAWRQQYLPDQGFAVGAGQEEDGCEGEAGTPATDSHGWTTELGSSPTLLIGC